MRSPSSTAIIVILSMTFAILVMRVPIQLKPEFFYYLTMIHNCGDQRHASASFRNLDISFIYLFFM